MSKQNITEEVLPIAFDLVEMIMEGLLSNRKTKTFHVSRVAKKLQVLIDKEREAGKREGIEMLEGAKIPYEHYWPRAKQEQRLCETCNEVVERYTPCKASKHYPCWQALNDLIQLIQEEI